MKISEEDIKEAVDALRRGDIILYPTDTVWGIGCDATNSDAVKRVFEIKRRADSKALILLVGDINSLWRYVCDVPEIAEQLIEVSDRPVTVVYDRARNVAAEAVAADGSVAIRVTSEAYSKELCRRLGRPIVSTSANVSGEPAAATFAEISDDIKNSVDYIAQYGRDNKTPALPSIIIKISSDSSFKIIRK